ncbi:DUF4279 domain-containing protein [Paenibacillus ehimensis]|uniref:DUF4279 domain-containing protein n=1 Tax=Paenibacillus ehimensis TaxID=79264 RepID=UPI000FD6DD0C|nr:DUF4279 domain-containing protein [Paenibacillus ehimensis]
MSTLGSCVLTVANTKSLDFSKISEKLNLVATSTTKKGEFIGRAKIRTSQWDRWNYEVTIKADTTPEEVLEQFLMNLEPVAAEINNLQSFHEVTLDCYLRSDFGQMGLSLSPNIVQLLAKLNLGLELHILSFGGVEK